MGWAFKIDPEEKDFVIDETTGQLALVGTYRDPVTRSWVTNGSDVEPDILLAIGTPLGSFGGNANFGSRVEEVVFRERDAIDAKLVDAITEALQTLVSAGRLTIQDVSVQLERENKLAVCEVTALELKEPFLLTLGKV